MTRVYSVAEAEKFIKANTESLPIIEKKWDFAENTTATEGENVPVVSGSAAWDETNQNIKFNANVTVPGTLSLKLNPAIGNKANVNFDLYVGALGGQPHSEKQLVVLLVLQRTQPLRVQLLQFFDDPQGGRLVPHGAPPMYKNGVILSRILWE